MDGEAVTDSNLSPALQMTTWLLLGITSLVLGFRLLTRFCLKTSRQFAFEDALILASYIFSLGESITAVIPQSSIFGRDISGISEEELDAGVKVGYARDLLFILCVGFSKLSVYTSLLSLSPHRAHRLIAHALGVLVVIWTASSFLGMAFQCWTRGPWESKYRGCSSQRAVLDYVAISNIISDLALIALPIWIIYPLQMPFLTRMAVASFYLARLSAIGATIGQLIYVPRLSEDNFTLRSFPYYLSMQLAQFTSIFAACVIYFWPLLRSLQTGLIWANNTSFAPQYALSRTQKSSHQETQGSAVASYSRNRDRRDYIEITTDIDILRDANGQGSISAAERYNLAWNHTTIGS